MRMILLVIITLVSSCFAIVADDSTQVNFLPVEDPILYPIDPVIDPIPVKRRCYSSGAMCSDGPIRYMMMVYREDYECFHPENCQLILGKCNWLITDEFRACEAKYGISIDPQPYPVKPIKRYPTPIVL
jgi:hypothetical protein